MIKEIECKEGVMVVMFNGYSATDHKLAMDIITNSEGGGIYINTIVAKLYDSYGFMPYIIGMNKFEFEVKELINRMVMDTYLIDSKDGILVNPDLFKV